MRMVLKSLKSKDGTTFRNTGPCGPRKFLEIRFIFIVSQSDCRRPSLAARIGEVLTKHGSYLLSHTMAGWFEIIRREQAA